MTVITTDTSGPPSQSPLSGARPGMDVSGLIRRLSDALGYKTDNPRFRSAAITWIQDTLLELQLADPKLQRVYVMEATVTLTSGQADYDVRTDWGWTNCYAVGLVKIAELENRVLERVNPEEYRYRGVITAASGPPQYMVVLDQFRVRMVPTPSQSYTAYGDYQQEIPQIGQDNDRIDWPRAWDIVLLEGALYRGYKWRSEQDRVWVTQRQVFRDLLNELKTGEKILARQPGKVVMTRSRRGTVVPHDNSSDVRRRY